MTSALKSKAQRLWLIAGWLLILLVIVASLRPVELEVQAGFTDKFKHALAYGTLMLWFANLYVRPVRRVVLAIAFVALGIALEFAQGLTDYRTFEIGDMVANAVGVAIGWAFAPPRLPNFMRRFEKVFGSA